MNDMQDLSGLEHCGLVHIYAGDGKGKTTAAAGLAVRAVGQGLNVIFCQFLKGRETGELKPLESLGVKIVRAECSGKFIPQMTKAEIEEAAALHEKCLDNIAAMIAAGWTGILVLDEVLDAVNAGFISEDSLITLIKSKPDGVEIILTGRNPSPDICALSAYRTDFVCVSHPYRDGLGARRGIEY